MSDKEPKVLQDSEGCEHLWLDYEPGPCPTCAEVKAAREEGRRQGMDDLAVQGYLTMGNCAHYWDGPGSCPVCIQIKAAEDKRGKEVLESLIKATCFMCRGESENHHSEVFEIVGEYRHANDKYNTHRLCEAGNIRQAYRERHDQG
ncbi:hypothetical protein LCGC14_1534750 [marine sediment metagenome]|uniref:Uncharacterized protein n=1 Tax=marine sediment metagenome TaxID=412755 RepID=A0A0F9IUX1_9ZZZZ